MSNNHAVPFVSWRKTAALALRAAHGCQGLSEGHRPALCLVLYQSTRQAASCCCRGRLRVTAVARAAGGPSSQQQDAWCPRVPLISVLYFPLTLFSLPWQQQCSSSPSSRPCDEAKIKKPKARFGKIAKGSEMTVMAVRGSYRRKIKQVPSFKTLFCVH